MCSIDKAFIYSSNSKRKSRLYTIEWIEEISFFITSTLELLRNYISLFTILFGTMEEVKVKVPSEIFNGSPFYRPFDGMADR